MIRCIDKKLISLGIDDKNENSIMLETDNDDPSYIEKFKEEYSKEKSNLNMFLNMKEQMKEVIKC